MSVQSRHNMKRPGEKRRKAKRLQPRQRRLLKGILRGKSSRRAALDAGYSERSANHPAELLSTASLRKALRQSLPSVEQIAKRIGQGLDAKRTTFATFEGVITDSLDCVDYRERRKHAELALRLHGLFDEEAAFPQNVIVRIVRNARLEDIKSGVSFADETEASES